MSTKKKETRLTALTSVQDALRAAGGRNVCTVRNGRTVHVLSEVHGSRELYAVIGTSHEGGGLQTREIAGVESRLRAHAKDLGATPYVAAVSVHTPGDVRWEKPSTLTRLHTSRAAARAAAGATATLVGLTLDDLPNQV